MIVEGTALANFFEGETLFSVPSDVKELKFQGENKNKVLVLCYSESGTLPLDEKELVRKILDAFKLNEADVALIESNESLPFHVLKDSIFLDKLLVFGFSFSAIGLNITCGNYPVIDFRDTKIVFSESLSLLKESEKAKTQLWKSLKSLFAVA